MGAANPKPNQPLPPRQESGIQAIPQNVVICKHLTEINSRKTIQKDKSRKARARVDYNSVPVRPNRDRKVKRNRIFL